MKTATLTRGQIDGWSIVIGVVVASSRWSCNDGGESHGRLVKLCHTCFSKENQVQYMHARIKFHAYSDI
jgi:hypothetical protein